MRTFKRLFATVMNWAVRFEPAVARGAVTQVFAVLALLGVKFGDWPHNADVVITLLATALPLLQAAWTRRGVISPATLADRTAHAMRVAAPIPSPEPES